ncbi:sterile alpha motif domain-containing protein 1-like [Cuculus canorus]|uniref:sterile alpha motif domain-containing protein 1-like n=1 Tax=Cuculus canorus TaxID=55661 RepID=UPI0023AB2747|nr:sterile alpha motif domain-containing protein 1-like [Cuculus canorus]
MLPDPPRVPAQRLLLAPAAPPRAAPGQAQREERKEAPHALPASAAPAGTQRCPHTRPRPRCWQCASCSLGPLYRAGPDPAPGRHCPPPPRPEPGEGPGAVPGLARRLGRSPRPVLVSQLNAEAAALSPADPARGKNFLGEITGWLRELGLFSVEERGRRRDRVAACSSCSLRTGTQQPLTPGTAHPGHWLLPAPVAPAQGEAAWPQAAPGEVQTRCQEKKKHRKGHRALAEAVQGGG